MGLQFAVDNMDIRFFAWLNPNEEVKDANDASFQQSRIEKCKAEHKHSHCCKADEGYWFCPNCGEQEPEL